MAIACPEIFASDVYLSCVTDRPDAFSTRRASLLKESAWYSFANCTGSRCESRFSLFSIRSWTFT